MTEIGAGGQTPEEQVLRSRYLQELRSRRAELEEQNKHGLLELRQQGLEFDSTQLVYGRISCLMGTIAKVMGPEDGPLFEAQAMLDWEERVAQNIVAARQNATKLQLEQGTRWSGAMIAKLAREAGTFAVRRV